MDIFFIDVSLISYGLMNAMILSPQGIEIVFRIAVALLEYHSNELLRLDLEDMIKVVMCAYV